MSHYLFANWKANKNAAQLRTWAEEFQNGLHSTTAPLEVVVLPSFVHLAELNSLLPKVALGVQTLSPFANGAYTGAVTAAMVREYAQYALLGHAERRTHFHETDQVVAQQVEQALASGVVPVVAVHDQNWSSQLAMFTNEQLARLLVMYEPPEAISTGGGVAADVNAVVQVVTQIKQAYAVAGVLYGGSVSAANARTFFAQDSIDGAVVGAASLDAATFLTIVQEALAGVKSK